MALAGFLREVPVFTAPMTDLLQHGPAEPIWRPVTHPDHHYQAPDHEAYHSRSTPCADHCAAERAARAALRKMRHQPSWRLSQQAPTGIKTCRILGWSSSQVRVDTLLCEDRLSVTT